MTDVSLIATARLRLVAVHAETDGDFFELAAYGADPDAPTIRVPREAIVDVERVEGAR